MRIFVSDLPYFSPYPVQWYEGMLLRPHHLQQADLHAHSLMRYVLNATHPFFWGVTYCKIDESLLVEGVVHIQKCSAFMPDGTIAVYNEASVGTTLPSQENLRIALHDAFKDQSADCQLTVFLCHYDRLRNSSDLDASCQAHPSTPLEDRNIVGNAIDVTFLHPQLFLHVGKTPPVNVVSLPLMQITYDGKNYHITNYIPPQHDVKLSSALGDMCLKIIVHLKEKVIYLHGQMEGASHGGASSHSAMSYLQDIKRRILRGLVPFEAMIRCNAAHPLNLFTYLASMAGDCAGFHPTIVLPQFPSYDHNNIRACFEPLIDFIHQALDSINQTHRTVLLTQHKRIFALSHDGDMMRGISMPYLLFIVRSAYEMTHQDLTAWIKTCVVASESMVSVAKENRTLGAKRDMLDHDAHASVVAPKDGILMRVFIPDDYIKTHETIYIFNISDSEQKRPASISLHISVNNADA